jgi:hypothetical protein
MAEREGQVLIDSNVTYYGTSKSNDIQMALVGVL